MFYIITDFRHKRIKNVEAYFKSICSQIDFTDPVCQDIMNAVDHSIYLGNETMKTPFGVTHVSNMCTSAKTVMLLYLLRNEKIYVPLMECGPNAIEYAFMMSNQFDLYAVMRYPFLLSNKSNWKCHINGVYVEGSSEICDEMQYATRNYKL